MKCHPISPAAVSAWSYLLTHDTQGEDPRHRSVLGPQFAPKLEYIPIIRSLNRNGHLTLSTATSVLSYLYTHDTQGGIKG
jgi:hypothetical protein